MPPFAAQVPSPWWGRVRRGNPNARRRARPNGDCGGAPTVRVPQPLPTRGGDGGGAASPPRPSASPRTAAGAVGLRLALFAIGPPPLQVAAEVSATVLDRHDRLLRAFTTADGRWRLPVAPAEVDPRYLAMLMTFEDRRFWTHHGIDPLALARAAGQLVRHARIVSGASTLTMQVARLLDQRHERTAVGKLRQMLRAVQLESALGKAEILTLYLRLAPFGGNVEGARRRARLLRQGAAPARSARRRCSSPCRNRRKCAVPTAIPRPPAARATACSSAPPPARSRAPRPRAPGSSRSPPRAASSPSSRRTSPRPSSRASPPAACTA